MKLQTPSLEPVRLEDKEILARLLELYLHDLSEFYNDLSLNEQGLFGYRRLDSYWEEEGRFAYFIRQNDELAGFTLVRSVDGVNSIAEFFIARRYRRLGIGAAAVKALLSRHPGSWSISHLSDNEPAARFWRKVIPPDAECTENGADTVYRFLAASQSRSS